MKSKGRQEKCFDCGINPKIVEVKMRLDDGMVGEYLCPSCYEWRKKEYEKAREAQYENKTKKKKIKKEIDWGITPEMEKFWADEAKAHENDSHLWQIDLTNKQVAMIRSAVRSHEPWDKEWAELLYKIVLNLEKKN